MALLKYIKLCGLIPDLVSGNHHGGFNPKPDHYHREFNPRLGHHHRGFNLGRGVGQGAKKGHIFGLIWPIRY